MQIGNLIFEITGDGTDRKLQVSAGPDVLVTHANSYASLLSQLADSLRQGLTELADLGMPRTYHFSASASDSTALVFTLSAVDGDRNLDVGSYGYVSLADERRDYISSGLISTAVLDDLASWFDSQGG